MGGLDCNIRSWDAVEAWQFRAYGYGVLIVRAVKRPSAYDEGRSPSLPVTKGDRFPHS
ncbi:MAG TPA: hypothetical protein V6C88_04095 [Chroococcidiopsis sp.]